jgi:hypothetical protein
VMSSVLLLLCANDELLKSVRGLQTLWVLHRTFCSKPHLVPKSS